MVAIIIPAHNEEAVIARCLDALLKGAPRGDLEIVVVANGCTDNTAEIARAYGPPVTVIETEVPSKSNALNLGDEAAQGFPRFYVDADVVLEYRSIRAMAAALERGDALAVSPAARMNLARSSWAVRSYYRVWLSLPYVREGLMGAGVYGLSREGRARFGEFPAIIADDGYVRLQFSARERAALPAAVSTVSAPVSLAGLLTIKTRSRLGFYQLRQAYPALFRREAAGKGYHGAALGVFLRPALWPHALPYLWVNLVTRLRARRARRDLERYQWERDTSSRVPARPLEHALTANDR